MLGGYGSRGVRVGFGAGLVAVTDDHADDFYFLWLVQFNIGPLKIKWVWGAKLQCAGGRSTT